MPKYTLYYFDLTGRAEVIRMVFRHADVEFEDHRLKFEEWTEFKKNNGKLVPFGQLPALEVDGEIITQSFAIARFVANEFGLYGKTNLEKAKIDMISDGLAEIFAQIAARFKEKDETRKAAMKKDFLENQVPAALQIYEEKFVPTDGFLIGDTVSLADIHFRAMMEILISISPDVLEKFPKVKALHERIGNTPNLKTYIESRNKKKEA